MQSPLHTNRRTLQYVEIATALLRLVADLKGQERQLTTGRQWDNLDVLAQQVLQCASQMCFKHTTGREESGITVPKNYPGREKLIHYSIDDNWASPGNFLSITSHAPWGYTRKGSLSALKQYSSVAQAAVQILDLLPTDGLLLKDSSEFDAGRFGILHPAGAVDLFRERVRDFLADPFNWACLVQPKQVQLIGEAGVKSPITRSSPLGPEEALRIVSTLPGWEGSTYDWSLAHFMLARMAAVDKSGIERGISTLSETTRPSPSRKGPVFNFSENSIRVPRAQSEEAKAPVGIEVTDSPCMPQPPRPEASLRDWKEWLKLVASSVEQSLCSVLGPRIRCDIQHEAMTPFQLLPEAVPERYRDLARGPIFKGCEFDCLNFSNFSVDSDINELREDQKREFSALLAVCEVILKLPAPEKALHADEKAKFSRGEVCFSHDYVEFENWRAEALTFLAGRLGASSDHLLLRLLLECPQDTLVAERFDRVGYRSGVALLRPLVNRIARITTDGREFVNQVAAAGALMPGERPSGD